jgi:hypothetical protein
MNKLINGVDTLAYTVALENKPGQLEEALFVLKSVNIIGLKLVNNGDFGAIQFVVEPQLVKVTNTLLSKSGFFYTTSIVYGVYLNNTPSALYSTIIKPVSKLGVNITNIFTSVGTPRVFVGFDDNKKVVMLLRSIPIPSYTNERTLVTA